MSKYLRQPPQALSPIELDLTKKVFRENYDLVGETVDRFIDEIAKLAYANGVEDTRKNITDHTPDFFPDLPPPAMLYSLFPNAPRYYESGQMHLHADAAVQCYEKTRAPKDPADGDAVAWAVWNIREDKPKFISTNKGYIKTFMGTVVKAHEPYEFRALTVEQLIALVRLHNKVTSL